MAYNRLFSRQGSSVSSFTRANYIMLNVASEKGPTPESSKAIERRLIPSSVPTTDFASSYSRFIS